MLKYLFICATALLLIIVLWSLFYWNQRVVYVKKEFKRVNTEVSIENLKFNCCINGEWKTFLDSPISVDNYGEPYEVMFSISYPEKIEHIELLKLSIHYESSSFTCKTFHVIYDHSKYNEQYKNYLSIANFPIAHETGKTVKLKYRLKLFFKDKTIEKDLEAEFKATRTIEKGYKILDMYMGI